MTLPYTLTCTTPGDLWKGGTVPAQYRIISKRSGRTVGFVKKVEGGAEGDSTPCFTEKTRKEAVARLWESLAGAEHSVYYYRLYGTTPLS